MYAAMAVLVFGILFKVGPSEIYNGLVDVLSTKPVLQPDATEASRSYQYDPLNVANVGGICFLIVNIIGNLGAVICNQTYWARSIAAKDAKTIGKSFGTAAFCWTPVPIAVATALGLYALSSKLTVGQVYQNGGLSMMFSEADSVAPLSAFLSMGIIGLLCFLIATMGASVSTGAGEIMSVTTCVVNYIGHINKDATDKQILVLSKVMLAVIPVILALVWKKQIRTAYLRRLSYGL